MVGSPKNKPPLGAPSQRAAKRQGSLDKTGTESAEEKQHKANLVNVGTIIQHAVGSVRGFGVDRSLIEIQKTVRHWPLQIDETDLHTFTPAFNATEISAEEVTQDSETITSVSFSYLGQVYDFVSRIKEDALNEPTSGFITLHENGDRVISMEVLQNQGQEQFTFQELSAFKFGTWMENIVRIGAEIEQHNERLAEKSDEARR